MRLVHNWRAVLKHAWSVRFMLLAALFTGIEAAVPLLRDVLPISPGPFAILSGLSVAAGLLARFVAQRRLKPLEPDEEVEP